jgi:predicted AAA+ superfamily ATPase
LSVLFDSGFPGTRHLDPVAWLRAYADSVAERSVEERRGPGKVGRFLRVLAELESAAVPNERIIELAELNRETILGYGEMLERAHVSVPVPAWETNRLKRITTFPKRHLVDSALSLAIAGVGLDALMLDPTLSGAYFESFVACQLRPEVEDVGGRMYHLRTKAGEREIDLVLDVGGDLVLFEVKASVRPTARDARHLTWARTELGSRVKAAVVLHRGSASHELTEGVWALPASLLWA